MENINILVYFILKKNIELNEFNICLFVIFILLLIGFFIFVIGVKLFFENVLCFIKRYCLIDVFIKILFY